MNRIVALGFFDGVHLGHGALLRECRSLADRLGVEAAAVTFSVHPQALIRGNAPALVNSAADREHLMRSLYGMDEVITLPFDRTLMTMPWQDFFQKLIDQYGAAGLVCGHDFRFGNRGEGNAARLKAACEAAGIPCTVIPEQKIDGVTVSSTHIRSLLERGEMEKAVRFLGHPHILSGEVVTGRGIGRTIGVPTANLSLPEEVVVPMYGVYACKAMVEGEEYLAAIMKEFWNEPCLGFCLDTGHEMCYNEHRDMLALYGEKLCHTHLNDNLGVRGSEITFYDDLHTLPTDGIADWHNIMERIEKTGYDGFLMSELSRHNTVGRDGVELRYGDLTTEEFHVLAMEKIKKAISM